MSIKLINLAWDTKGLSHIEKLVLLALADNANDAGVSWPSVGSLADRSCCTQRAVFKVIATLKDKGLLSSKHRHNNTSVYTLNLGGERGSGGEPETPRPEPGAPTPERGSGPDLNVVHPEPSGNHHDEPPKNRAALSADEIPAGLDVEAWDFWLKYRKEICRPFKSKQTLIAQAQKLAAFGKDQAAVVRQSIDEGWQGLFAIKTNAPAKGPIPAQLWDAESEQWVATHGLPKWKVDKLIKQAEDSKAFESTFAGTAPVKRDGGAAT